MEEFNNKFEVVKERTKEQKDRSIEISSMRNRKQSE